MNLLLLVLKGVAFLALACFIVYCAYRHRYTKPYTKDEQRCAQCGMPDWAREERCWNQGCPRTKP